MSYDLEEMLFLLLSLKHTTSSSFVTEHLSFSGVGALCSEAIREGFIIETRKELKITDKGLAFISETNNKLNRHGIERSIARIPDVYIEKLPASVSHFCDSDASSYCECFLAFKPQTNSPFVEDAKMPVCLSQLLLWKEEVGFGHHIFNMLHILKMRWPTDIFS